MRVWTFLLRERACQTGQIRVPAESNEDLAARDRVAAHNFNLGDGGERDDGQQNHNRWRADGSRSEKRTADLHLTATVQV
jgi:hypothetical protein